MIKSLEQIPSLAFLLEFVRGEPNLSSAQRIWQSDTPSLFLALNTNQNGWMKIISQNPDS